MQSIYVRIILFGLIICVGLIICGLIANDVLSSDNQSLKDNPIKPFLGVYMNPIDDLSKYGDDFIGKKGIQVPVVIYQSSADQAGVKKGDIILSYDGKTFDKIKKSDCNKVFRDYIREEKKVGAPIQLTILRQTIHLSGNLNTEPITQTEFNSEFIEKMIDQAKADETISLNVIKNQNLLEITAILGEKQFMLKDPPPDNQTLFPKYDHYSDPFITIPLSLIDAYTLKEDYDDLIKRYDDDEWWDDGFRLSIFRYVHRNPLMIPKIGDDISKQFSQSIHQHEIDFSRWSSASSDMLDITPIQRDEIDLLTLPESWQSYTDCVNQIHTIIIEAKKWRDIAFNNLTSDEIQFIKKHLPIVFDKLIDHYYLDSNAKMEEMDNHRRLVELSKSIDYQALLKASFILNQLSSNTWLTAISSLAQLPNPIFDCQPGKYGISGDVLFMKQTDIGMVVIGGPGLTRYAKPIPVIIDMGGNDIYLTQVGAGDIIHHSIGLLIDLKGNDIYSSTDKFSHGSGFLGCGLLIDCDGDDHYIGSRLTQGCALMGTGILIDKVGNDQYIGQEFHQGVAFWGIGHLIDLNGNDSYQASLFSQAVGGTKGFGAILDCQGNDTYLVTSRYQSSYETNGVFRGSSQGFGFGFRGIASGGVGMLLDLDGEDRFTAGNFSQGGGYFFGLGLLRNFGNNNDMYLGSRYGQGFSAHSAVGILIDDGGDDLYKGIMGALQSAAWDLGAAALIDKSGNDTYDNQLTFFSLSSAAHNGFSLFIDMQGKDAYLTGQTPIAQSYPNDYHNGYSFGFFIDSGGQQDYYEKGNENNQIYHSGNHSLFIDLPSEAFSYSSSEELKPLMIQFD